MIQNSINKEPGVNQVLYSWLSKECERTGTKCLDLLIFGASNNGIHIGGGLNIATPVLPFVFLAYNRFRFPFAYFRTGGLSVGHLTHIFWDRVKRLKTVGFLVSCVCMDGAATNRSFINRLCGATLPVAINIAFLEEKIACIMNFSALVKKLRISIYASGIDNCKRQFTGIHGPIDWKHFSDAYHWDKHNFFVNCTLQMCNFLAEQVLNSDMLQLAIECILPNEGYLQWGNYKSWCISIQVSLSIFTSGVGTVR